MLLLTGLNSVCGPLSLLGYPTYSYLRHPTTKAKGQNTTLIWPPHSAPSFRPIPITRITSPPHHNAHTLMPQILPPCFTPWTSSGSSITIISVSIEGLQVQNANSTIPFLKRYPLSLQAPVRSCASNPAPTRVDSSHSRQMAHYPQAPSSVTG